MTVCPKCGATVPEGATTCSYCGSPLTTQQASPTTVQSTPMSSSTWSIGTDNSDTSARLEKALRRSELLTYAAIGLGIVIAIIILL